MPPQDAEAAARICEALRAAGIEVWFDRSELRGGDAWDSQIKKQIHDCALFIPLISAHTNARSEGYFRGEWHLATRRLHNMADDAAFLVPVVVDDTREADARVPEEFLRSQWTWLPGGETPPAFAQTSSPAAGLGSQPCTYGEGAATGAIEPSARNPGSPRQRGHAAGMRGSDFPSLHCYWFWAVGLSGTSKARATRLRRSRQRRRYRPLRQARPTRSRLRCCRLRT